MNSIIFLDFDGVINSEAFYVKRGKKRHGLKWPFSEIDPSSVENLNYIIRRTGAKIVISSTWRMGETNESLKKLCHQIGIRGEMIGSTIISNCNLCLRGNEIHQYIKENCDSEEVPYYKYNNYVILDDDSDMLYWQKDNFVKTDRKVGLTRIDAIKACNILSGSNLGHRPMENWEKKATETFFNNLAE